MYIVYYDYWLDDKDVVADADTTYSGIMIDNRKSNYGNGDPPVMNCIEVSQSVFNLLC